MPPKEVLTLRLDPALRDWLTAFAAEHGVDRTAVVTDMIEALREGRMVVRPRASASPFPVHDVEAGTSPDFPLYVYFQESP